MKQIQIITILDGKVVVLDSRNAAHKAIIKEKVAHVKIIDRDIVIATEKDKHIRVILIELSKKRKVYLECTILTVGLITTSKGKGKGKDKGSGIRFHLSPMLINGLGDLRKLYFENDQKVIYSSFKKIWSYLKPVAPFVQHQEAACFSPLYFTINGKEIKAKDKWYKKTILPSYRKVDEKVLKMLSIQTFVSIIQKHPNEWLTIFKEKDTHKNALDDLYQFIKDIKKLYPESMTKSMMHFLDEVKLHRKDVEKKSNSKAEKELAKVNKLLRSLVKVALELDLTNILQNPSTKKK